MRRQTTFVGEMAQKFRDQFVHKQGTFIGAGTCQGNGVRGQNGTAGGDCRFQTHFRRRSYALSSSGAGIACLHFRQRRDVRPLRPACSARNGPSHIGHGRFNGRSQLAYVHSGKLPQPKNVLPRRLLRSLSCPLHFSCGQGTPVEIDRVFLHFGYPEQARKRPLRPVRMAISDPHFSQTSPDGSASEASSGWVLRHSGNPEQARKRPLRPHLITKTFPHFSQILSVSSWSDALSSLRCPSALCRSVANGP